jgi:hypothetical protein
MLNSRAIFLTEKSRTSLLSVTSLVAHFIMSSGVEPVSVLSS